MNLKKFLKWSLVLMAFIAYKKLEAGEGQEDYPRTIYSIVTLAE